MLGLLAALFVPAVTVSGLTQPHEDHALPGWKGEVAGDAVAYGKEEWRGEIVQLSWSPRAYVLKGFLSDEETQHLIDLGRPSMHKSTVADNKTGKSMDSEIRTSTGTFLANAQDDVVERIERRVAQVTMIPEENQEGFQILHYEDGQKYEPHHDFFHDTVNPSPSRGGQRIATVLMYLSTPEEGGETVFPNADRKVVGPEWSDCAKKGLAVKARRGDAVMFFSLKPDGSTDSSSLHGSCPTTKGEKWSATKWIHVLASRSSRQQQTAAWAGLKKSEDEPCVNVDAECSEWAESGECDNNRPYMLAKCAKACNFC